MYRYIGETGGTVKWVIDERVIKGLLIEVRSV